MGDLNRTMMSVLSEYREAIRKNKAMVVFGLNPVLARMLKSRPRTKYSEVPTPDGFPSYTAAREDIVTAALKYVKSQLPRLQAAATAAGRGARRPDVVEAFRRIRYTVRRSREDAEETRQARILRRIARRAAGRV